jgi:ferredoxin
MKIVVDLNRCQSYGQCVFAAPKVFHFHGSNRSNMTTILTNEFTYRSRRAAAACPVQAISIGHDDDDMDHNSQKVDRS